jgi:molybdopterin-containing oxidoreductase family membrane subunit
MIVAYSYFIEGFMAWYGGNPYEAHQILAERPFGAYRYYWYALIACNILVPQLLWSGRSRRSLLGLWLISWSSTWGCGWSGSSSW